MTVCFVSHLQLFTLMVNLVTMVISVLQFKLLLLPVAGAVIGGAIAGPVGLVAGLKAGKMAAVGGSLLGKGTEGLNIYV